MVEVDKEQEGNNGDSRLSVLGSGCPPSLSTSMLMSRAMRQDSVFFGTRCNQQLYDEFYQCC